ncbi:serine/threonine-protein kinase ATM-like [Telopea speciosissima]|uniref:serine/threonine-protein kinase ATM-like n=1 Tax=Telopea speciosissima TaxID=54955 RepID=UPI001CC79A74|nr:serine/threonine-protein kinase ATM-like [Telopea speciosissima]
MSVPMVETKKNNSEEGREEKEVDEGEEEEQVANDQEHEFSIGDFVWAKIKSHPWWPGQIYDPSDASKYAAKFHRRDRLLVGYFGDGTFAWCYPSQLKPFEENFELMSNQSNSKSFLNAVEEAVDEIGRRVELEMTCTCVPEEIRNQIARPLAVNAGIREGVVVPDGGIGELTVTLYEPAELLALLRDFAEVVSVNSILELTVLRSRLSAFFRAKGYQQLPMYYEGEDVSGTEDFAVNEEMHKTVVDGLTEELILQPTEVDWLSSPASHGVIKPCQTSSQRWPGISDDKLYQRKKQKSMAELLAGEVDVEHRNGESDAAGEILSGKPVSTSKKKRESSEDDINIAAEDSTGDYMGLQNKKLNKSKLLVSPPTADKESSSINNDDTGAKVAGVSSSPRMRKKSKYLSPPYTDLIWVNKSLNSSKDSETESPKDKMVSSVEECIRRATDQLAGTPPTVRCSGQTSQKKLSKESGVRRKTSSNLSPRTPNSVNYKNIFVEDNTFIDEMFSDFLTIALDPFYLDGSQRFDTFKGFFSRFRSSVYCNESNYEQLVVQSGRKRKSLESNLDSSGQASQETDQSCRRKSLESNPGLSGRVSKATDQSGRRRKSLENSPGSSGRASQATDQSGRRKKSLESNPGSSGLASQATDQTGKRRKSLESNPGSSGRASQAIDHQSSEPKSKRKREETDAAFSRNAKSELQQVDVTSGLKMDLNKEETKDESSAAVRASQATVHPSSEPKSKRKRGKTEEAFSRNAKRELKQVDVPSGLKMDLNKEETKDESSAAVRSSQATVHSSPEPKFKKKRGKTVEAVSRNAKSELQQVDVTSGLKMDLNKEETKDESSAAVRASQATVHPSSEPKSKRKRGKAEEAFSWNAKSKLQQVGVTSGLKLDLNKEETKDESSAAALLLTFAPGFSLPSKDDMITIFGRFGSLNEKETEVLRDSNCARVAFMRSSDAEEAFNSSQKVSPFGHAVVNYRLHYSSAISGAVELDGSSHLQPTPLLIEGNEPSVNPSTSRLMPAAGEAPPLVFIKQNLEMMTSMLEKSGDKLSPKVKANLEGEIKCLLNKLSTMDESFSS